MFFFTFTYFILTVTTSFLHQKQTMYWWSQHGLPICPNLPLVNIMRADSVCGKGGFAHRKGALKL